MSERPARGDSPRGNALGTVPIERSAASNEDLHRGLSPLPKPPRILIASAAGYTNLGDDAIADALTARLKRELPQARLSIIAGPGFAPGARSRGIARLRWSDIEQIAAAVRDSDAVVVGGGGVLYDSTFVAHDVDIFRMPSQWPARVARLAILARIARRPFMLYSVGVGALFSPAARDLALFVAQTARCISVRDAYSQQALIDCGTAQAAVHLAADPAIELSPPTEDQAREEIARRGLSGLPRPWIALNLRPWFRFQGAPLASRPKMDLLTEAVREAAQRVARETGGSIIGLPFQAGRDADRPLLCRALDRLLERKRAAVIGLSSPRVAQALISQADAAIGMRLHLHVFAARCGIPSVALAYDPKVACFMSDLGMEGFSLPADGISADAIAQAATQAIARRAELQDRIRAGCAALAQRGDVSAALLRHLLHETEPPVAAPRLDAAQAGWPAERAALLHYLSVLEHGGAGRRQHGADLVRWLTELMRRFTGRG